MMMTFRDIVTTIVLYVLFLCITLCEWVYRYRKEVLSFCFFTGFVLTVFSITFKEPFLFILGVVDMIIPCFLVVYFDRKK